ncbi:(2Fe-2S)-binding protein [Halomonas maura]|uniref:(2Fe-2S)-binding protein n=1 Tax=Halomonas maura TaxID=117606 RepID=UPI0025B558D0|nr:(2Fe-2S)-binding protein [Halomonas maura]MDN3556941.1 (2Fe-2S)-binding protein [Halomonas maura]
MTTLTINGQTHELDAPDDMPLLWAIRDLVGHTGTKYGCGKGLCGACTVHLDGQPTRSCIIPLSAVGDRRVATIEAMAEDATGASVQQAWRELDVVQCGYCQSGQIMAATALLRDNPAPDDAAIDGAMNGNLCRCATYVRIRAAIHTAAASLGQEVS